MIITLVISIIALVVSLIAFAEVIGLKDIVSECIHTIKNKINPPQVMTEEEYKALWDNYNK